MDLASLLETRARERGAETFAIFPGDETSLTHAELVDGAHRWCRLLSERGLGVGSRLTFIAKKSADLLVAYFGGLLLGVTVHIVDERIDPGDMLRALDRFEPDLVLRDGFGRSRELDGAPAGLIVEDLPLLDALSGFEPLAPAPVPGHTAAICVFTSGSTGDPKGILSSHDNLLYAGAALDVHELTADDRVLGLTPISGTNGQVFSIWAPLLSGGSTIQYQGMFSSFLALDWAAEHGATWMNGTPTYLALFLANPVDPAEFDLQLRFYRSASAPLPAKVQNEFEADYGLPIIETMGLSEMSGQVFANPAAADARKQGSVGRPFRADLRIVDDRRQPVAAGEVGELEVRSDGLMLGYHRDPDATGEAIVDGWLRTGDLGVQDDDGFVFIRGRRKDIAIVGGKNVSLRRVDDALYALAGVQLATSFAVADDSAGGERIIAAVQLQPDAVDGADADDLLAVLKEALAPYEMPKQLEFWDALPIGGSGKVLRSRARKLHLENSQESD